MLLALEIIVLLVICCVLAVARVSRYIWTPVIALALLGASIFSHISWWFLIPLWVIYLFCAFIFNAPITRRKYLIKPVFELIKETLPPMSDTEKEALDSGDTWWEGELFSGRPNFKTLLDYPKATLSEAEQNFMDNEVETLCGMIDEWRFTHEYGEVPKDIWTYLSTSGFFGLIIDKEYGGKGFSALAHSSIVTKIATRSLSTAVTVMVPNSLGPAELLMHYGTVEQKKHYLPKLASGEEVPCFALTSSVAGSDATSITDRGEVCEEMFDGKKTLGMRINWDKRYITLAPNASVIGLAFKLTDPKHLLGDQYDLGITVCLVPANHPGVMTGMRHSPMNLAFANGVTRGEDVFVPMDWIIGGKEMIGQGWMMLMECLSIGRAISLPALSTAGAQLCYRMTGIYAFARKQFNMRIGYFEGVQASMAQIAGLTYLTEATRLLTASAVDLGVKPAVASAIAKYHLTENNRHIVNHAMDIHAGRGIQMGPRNYLADAYLGIPIGITVEGANILTRNLMIYGQGSIRCHPYVREEIDIAHWQDKKAAIKAFDKVLCRHIGFTVSTAITAFAWGVSGAHLITSPVKGKTAKFYKQFSRMSTALALVSDCAMLMIGGDLKRRERLSARLGDILSYLYLGTATLKYHHDHGTEEDYPYVKWCVEYCLWQIQTALGDFLKNFPARSVALCLRFLIFPLGRHFHKPSDAQDKILALSMLENSALRDRLTRDYYLNKQKDDKTGRMEYGFDILLKARGAEKKLQQVVREQKIPREGTYLELIEEAFIARAITSEEKTLLREAYLATSDIVAVDEFGVPNQQVNHHAEKPVKQQGE